MAGLRALHREDIHMIRGWNSIRYDTILTSPRSGMHVWFDMIAMDLDGSIYMVLRNFCIFVMSCFNCDFICDLFCTIHLASATFRIVFWLWFALLTIGLFACLPIPLQIGSIVTSFGGVVFLFLVWLFSLGTNTKTFHHTTSEP